MSIERSGSTPVSPKVSAGAESSGSKSKAKPADGPDGAAGAGFLALLTSLAPATVAADSGESSLLQGQSTESVSFAVPVSTGADQSNNLAMLMAQAGEVAGDKNKQDAVVSQAPDIPMASIPLVPAETKGTAITTGDPATVRASLIVDDVASGQIKAPTESPSVVARAPLTHMASSTANEKSDTALDVHDIGKAATTVKPDAAAGALLDGAKPSMGARASQNPGTGHLQSAAATAAQSRSANIGSVLNDLSSTPTTANAVANAVAASGWNEGLLRPSDRPGSKLTGLHSALGVEGAGGGHVFQMGSRADLPSAMVNPSMPTFESAVAEKLNYWIAQGVQNAELELDGFGDAPVAVRISMKGDEAHIGFRTDQPEIRRLLEGASAQLKDLLASEGLLLSQVSVGTSGQNGSGQQERRPPTGTRTGFVKAPDTAPVQGTRRPGVSVGTALDLFV